MEPKHEPENEKHIETATPKKVQGNSGSPTTDTKGQFWFVYKVEYCHV